MDSKKVGKFICELRKEKNWTQDELAEKLFVDRTMVSKWERGVYIPNTELLLKMQDLFDVSINEILFGERKTMDNNSDIDSIPLEIMKEEKKKTRKLLIFTVSVVLLLISSFLTYYFINNYNSIKIYKIFGESDDVIVSNGMLIYSKQKSYIRTGDIKSSKKINKIRLYFIKEKEEKNIFTGGENDSKQFFINEFNYNELYEYSDIKYILNSLKLEIIFENNETVIVKLNLVKEYANDNIIDDYKKPIGDEPLIINNDIQVPDYIIKYFNFDESNKIYYRKTEQIYEEFIIEQGIYIITISKQKNEEKIFYDLKDNTLSYYLFENNNITDSYIYNIENDSCEYGQCSKENIENIKNNYLAILYN